MLGVSSLRSAWIVGAGGKTSLMYALAADLAARGRRVVTTTSTRILAPPPCLVPWEALVVESDPMDAVARLPRGCAGWHRTIAAALDRKAGKLVGHEPSAIDAIVDSGRADHVLVEADGARGRPIKAHRDGEPVLGSSVGVVLAVLGLSCLGRPLGEDAVHRAGHFSLCTGLPPGTPIRPIDLRSLLVAPGGWLDRIPPAFPIAVVLAQAGAVSETTAAEVAALLLGGDRAGRLTSITSVELAPGGTAAQRAATRLYSPTP